MKLPRRAFLHLAAGAAALPAVSRIARAQTYPSRPITIVAPFPAGGATDIVSRTLAEGMKAPLGQTILVENVTGASGTRVGLPRSRMISRGRHQSASSDVRASPPRAMKA